MPPPTASVRPHPSAADDHLRAGTAGGIPDVLRELGADPAAVLASVGLAPDLFEDPEHPVPFSTVGHLMGACVERTGCPHFGLLVGRRGGLASTGLVGLLLQQSPHVGFALQHLALYLHLHDRGGIVTLDVSDGMATLAYELCAPGVESTDQIADGAIAIGCNILRALCGSAWRPTEVRLAHRRPRDARPYQRFFRAPIAFDAEQNALRFPATLLDQPLPHADPRLRQLLLDEVERLDAQFGANFATKVRRVLRAGLLAGQCSVDEIAGLFAMQRRTLSRRLRAEGTTFENLVAQMRYEFARQLLENTDLPISKVAGALCYADLAAFARAFRRWSGQPPGEWRRRRGATTQTAESVSGPPRGRDGGQAPTA
jgi:AraC-like DNA-binding protein